MDDVRGAGPVSLLCSPRSASNSGVNGSSWGLKLPMLTARPGNVGVQIDSFRTMKMFHRPRCGKFTAQFQGISFENHSMENHSRIVERTQLRARIVSERLQKLKEHEAKMVADEQRRRQRRKERELAEQRQQWLKRQAAKKEEQRQKEEQAARSIQRVARGSIARRCVREILEEHEMHRAACRLQSSLKTFVRKKRTEKSRQEQEKERRLRAAKVIQRQARRRRDSGRNLLDSLGGGNQSEATMDSATSEADSPEMVEKEEAESPECEPRQEAQSAEPPPGETTPTDALSRELSLELLFSILSPKTTSVGDLHVVASAGSEYSEPIRPRRPVTIKRVGGGFRQSTFQSPRLRTSKPPELAEAIASPRPQPPQHHRARVPRGRVPAGNTKHGIGVAGTAASGVKKYSVSTHSCGHADTVAVPYVEFSADGDAAADDEEDTLLDLVRQLDS